MASDKIIQAAGLTKKYGKAIAVNDIELSVAKGSTVGLLGGNGAGKTTTIAMILGLLLPSSGSLNVFGFDMAQERHKALVRMNFSSPYVDLPKRLTVRENLDIYARLYNVPHRRHRLREIAADFEIEAFLRKPYGALSAGQKTRVLLAKAMLNTPELLLLDEPTASLDPDTADWVRGYLQTYQRRTGATYFLASHNMAEVERLCSDVLIMRAGKIVDQGSPDTLIRKYGRRNMEEVFLDVARQGRAA